MLLGNKTEPGREVATTAELAYIRRKCSDRHCADGPDPRHRLKRAGHVVFFRCGSNPFVQRPDLGADLRNPVEVEPSKIADQLRNRLFFEALCQACSISDPLADDDPMFACVSYEP